MSMSAKDFLSSFYAEGKGWLEIRVLDKHGRISYFEQSVDEALVHVEKWRTLGKGANIYFGVCSRKEEGKHSLNDILYTKSVWVDLDATDDDERKTQLKKIKEFPLPPSLVVNSGNGFHIYWLLRKPTRKWASFAKIIKMFEKLLKSDSTGDIARILRVPGTMNTKDPSNPLPVLVAEEFSDWSRQYSLRDVALVSKLFDKELKLRHKISTGDSRGFPSRSERDWDVITKLVRAGFSDDTIRYIFAVHPIGDRARDDEHYFETTLTKARDARDAPGTPLNIIIKTPSDAATHSADESLVTIQSDDDDEEEESPETDWGFVVGDDDGFLWRTLGKDPHVVSTFVFEPKRLLKGDSVAIQDVLLGNVHASGHTWPNVRFTRRAFSRTDAMQKEITIAAWQWLGSDKDTKEYLPYLMSVLQEKGLPHTRAVPAIGRHGDVWVSTSGALTATEAFDELTAPLVYHAKAGHSLSIDYFFPPEDELEELKRRVREKMPKINIATSIWPMIGWFFATAYKPTLRKLNVRFPTLNVWGTRGSGKTSTITRIFLPLMGDSDPVGRDCSTTQFVMLSLLGATTSIPIAFTEFRQSAMSTSSYQRFLRYLLQAYDTGRDARGRPDQTVQQYPLTSPFSVDGEDMIADAAARERIVAVNFAPENIREGTDEALAFADLADLPLKGLAGAYVQFVLAQDARVRWLDAHSRITEAFPAPLPDRVRNNYAIVVLGILSYCEFMGAESPDLHVLRESIESLVTPGGRTTLLIDDFIEDVVNAVGLNAASSFFYKYYDGDNVLRFQLSTAFDWWYSKRRREGYDTLAKDALKQQLKERYKEYVLKPKGTSVNGTTKWMVGIDISKARTAGLDIPESLLSETEVSISI